MACSSSGADMSLEIPACLLCPITGTVMVDPVMMVETGFSYERSAIEKWLKQKDSDPTTNVRISRPAKLIPNHCLRQCIAEVAELQWVAASDRKKQLQAQTMHSLVSDNHADCVSKRTRRARASSPNQENSCSLYIRMVVVAACFLCFFLAERVLDKDWRFKPRQCVTFFFALQLLAQILAVILWQGCLKAQIFLEVFELADRKRENSQRKAQAEEPSDQDHPRDSRLRFLRTIKVPDGGGVRSLSVRGSRLLSASSNYEVRAWDLNSFRCVKFLQGSCPEVWSIAHSDLLLTGAMLHRVRSYGIGSPMEGFDVTVPRTSSAAQAALHSTASSPGCAVSPNRLHGAPQDGAEPERSRWCHGASLPGPLAMVVHGRWILAAAVDGCVRVHDRQTPEMRCVGTLLGHSGWVRAILCLEDATEEAPASPTSPRSAPKRGDEFGGRVWREVAAGEGDGPLGVVTGGNDCVIRVWTAEDGSWKCHRELHGHTGAVVGLIVHDGHLFSCSADSTVRVWRATGEWEALQVLDGHTGTVWCMAAQGGLLVTGADDSTVKLWGLRSVGATAMEDVREAE